MKRTIVIVIATVLVMGVAKTYAGEGCGGGMSKSSAMGSCCAGDTLSKLNLTDSQKARVENLKADCRRATSTSEYREMFNAGLQKILTPDQYAQWDAHSGKAMSSGGCPFMKSTGTKTGQQT